MISYLQGKLILKKDKFIVLDVHDIGYKVFLSKKSASKLPELGQVLKVFTFLDVKETAMDLYGFFSYQELEFFEMLNDIRGIGPKAAIEIASLGPLDALKDKILNQDEGIFSSIPGIGSKKAMSIILELTGKIKSISKEKSSGSDEVEETLVSLGFTRQQAKEAISKISKDVKDVQERIKLALQSLGKNKNGN